MQTILYQNFSLQYHMFRPLKDNDKLYAAQKELLNLLHRKSFEDSKSHADKVWPIFSFHDLLLSPLSTQCLLT